jgi:peroxiredoxin
MAVVFLQPGKLKVASTDSFSQVQVKGSEAHTAYRSLLDQEKPFQDRMKPLEEEYRTYSRNKDKSNMARVEKSLDSLDALKNEAVYAAFVRSNPGSPLALYALDRFAGWDIDADKVEPLFQQLSPAVKKYPSASSLEARIEIAKKTGIGRIAMDFTQADTSGLPVSLSSFRGKYLLVDFWASWCGPCRVENPNVVRVFEKYRDRNFHILGVSLDRPGQKERWMKAIHEDKLTWTHVSDLLFWENAVAKQYGIRAIPQNLLLDPEGKIIAKNLRGEDLDARLAELIR